MDQTRALSTGKTATSAALRNAIILWADSTTNPASARRRDLLRDKARVVLAFFEYTGKRPSMVTAIDVKTWQAELEDRGLAPATVYARISRVSSWYEWARQEPALAGEIGHNPAALARPKAPRAYQTESTKALDDDQVKALLVQVRARADSGDVVARRDYALLLFYLATGMRRNEVIRLRWGDVKIDARITLTTRVKGGDYANTEITDPRVRDALIGYLQAVATSN